MNCWNKFFAIAENDSPIKMDDVRESEEVNEENIVVG